MTHSNHESTSRASKKLERYAVRFLQGTIAFTLLDAKTDQALWQGWTTETLDQSKITGEELEKITHRILLDRKSRKTWIRHLKSKDSGYVIDKVKRIAHSSGARTITFDNDQSFALHYKLTLPTFFTHPYASQEKGSVENRIGLIRMFFGKKTDFTLVSAAQVKQVETLINNRPLRMFGYKTPNEVHNKS